MFKIYISINQVLKIVMHLKVEQFLWVFLTKRKLIIQSLTIVKVKILNNNLNVLIKLFGQEEEQFLLVMGH